MAHHALLRIHLCLIPYQKGSDIGDNCSKHHKYFLVKNRNKLIKNHAPCEKNRVIGNLRQESIARTQRAGRPPCIITGEWPFAHAHNDPHLFSTSGTAMVYNSGKKRKIKQWEKSLKHHSYPTISVAIAGSLTPCSPVSIRPANRHKYP